MVKSISGPSSIRGGMSRSSTKSGGMAKSGGTNMSGMGSGMSSPQPLEAVEAAAKINVQAK